MNIDGFRRHLDAAWGQMCAAARHRLSGDEAAYEAAYERVRGELFAAMVLVEKFNKQERVKYK